MPGISGGGVAETRSVSVFHKTKSHSVRHLNVHNSSGARCSKTGAYQGLLHISIAGAPTFHRGSLTPKRWHNKTFKNCVQSTCTAEATRSIATVLRGLPPAKKAITSVAPTPTRCGIWRPQCTPPARQPFGESQGRQPGCVCAGRVRSALGNVGAPPGPPLPPRRAIAPWHVNSCRSEAEAQTNT